MTSESKNAFLLHLNGWQGHSHIFRCGQFLKIRNCHCRSNAIQFDLKKSKIISKKVGICHWLLWLSLAAVTLKKGNTFSLSKDQWPVGLSHKLSLFPHSFKKGNSFPLFRPIGLFEKPCRRAFHISQGQPIILIGLSMY